MILVSHLHFTLKVALAVDNQRIVGNSLLGKGLVLAGIVSGIFCLDVQETGSTVVCQNLMPIVVVSQCQLVEVTMFHTMQRSLQRQSTIQLGTCGANDTYITFIALTTVGEHHTIINNRCSLTLGNVACYHISSHCRQQLSLILLRHCQ